MTLAGSAFSISEGENELRDVSAIELEADAVASANDLARFAAVLDAVDKGLLIGILNGRTVAELTTELSLPRGAVFLRLRRAMHRLERLLGE